MRGDLVKMLALQDMDSADLVELEQHNDAEVKWALERHRVYRLTPGQTDDAAARFVQALEIDVELAARWGLTGREDDRR